jgi:hypothetical protein
MTTRRLVWVAVAPLAGLLAACGDAGTGGHDPRPGYGPSGDPGSNQAVESTTPTNGQVDAGAGSSVIAPDAGASSDAGGGAQDAGGASGGVFSGAAAYVSTAGPSSRNGGHNFGANGTNPVKQACLGCHGSGGGAPLFTVGGSVFKDAAGTMPAANVEVRFVDANGTARSVYTDALGNFYFKGATLAAPGKVGARDATTTQNMTSTIANGDCNSAACHGGAQGWVHVP